MNFCKLFSVTFSLVLFSLWITPGSDATHLFSPLHVYTAAKLGTMGLIGKGALIAGIGIPLKAAAVVGGVAGAKAGALASSIKAPLLLTKSALPNLLSLAPLLKGLGKKKGGIARTPALPPPLPMLPPPPPPSFPQPMPAYAPPMIRSSY